MADSTKEATADAEMQEDDLPGEDSSDAILAKWAKQHLAKKRKVGQ